MNSFPWYATELFLSVCEAGGLSAASRFGKIGISQPALSAQMATLEAHLGMKLFQRKPFLLTAEGRHFQEETLRLRARMGLLRETLAADTHKPLRIAAADMIIRDHLPQLLKQIDAPSRTRLVLREAPSQDLPALVRDGEADLAIGVLSKHVHSGTSPLVEVIARLPLMLQVPPSHAKTVRQWSDLIRLLRQKEKPGLVSLPQNNLLAQHIHASLRKAGVEWHPTLEVSSLSHVPAYVRLDFGFGFCIVEKTPRGKTAGSRLIALSGDHMPSLNVGIWHREQLDPLAQKLMNLIRIYAREKL